jgi:hypothetical protein
MRLSTIPDARQRQPKDRLFGVRWGTDLNGVTRNVILNLKRFAVPGLCLVIRLAIRHCDSRQRRKRPCRNSLLVCLLLRP